MVNVICTVIKNEHSYLKEWISYHLSLGFKYIFIYEDFGSLSHKNICDEFPNVFLESIDFFKPIENNSMQKQYLIFNEFINYYSNVYDWVAFIDVDEFITLDKNLTLEETLLKYNDYNGIILFWKIYNANGFINKPDGNIIDIFTKVNNDISKLETPFKSIVNLKKNSHMCTHHKVAYPINTLYSTDINTPVYEIMWINHYFTKSWEEWCYRFSHRGDIVPGHRKIEEFFIYNPDMLLQKNELLELFYKNNPKLKNF